MAAVSAGAAHLQRLAHASASSSLPHPRKIIIAGNHDHAADNSTGWYERDGHKIHEEYSQPRADPARVRQLLQDRNGGLRYLEDEALELTVDRDGVRDKCWRIYGSPVSTGLAGLARLRAQRPLSGRRSSAAGRGTTSEAPR